MIWMVAGLTICSLAQFGFFNWGKFFNGGLNLAEFFAEVFPPRMEIIPVLFKAIAETIQIAFTGTVIGFVISLPLAFFGARNLFGRRSCAVVRFVTGGIRTVPSILFGVIFVVAFGLGPLAGTFGVALYTVGYLTKIFYEAFEAVDGEVIEAVGSTGCSRLQLFWFVILPESANTIISQVLFMFEYNIRASTIMGFVGAGGIGYYMVGYLQMLQYNHLLTALLLTFVVVMTIDYLSLRLRSVVVFSAPSKPA